MSINAQNTEAIDSLNTKQEVRLDLFQLIVLPGIDITYERFIDDLSSWGVTGFINFDNEFSEAYRFEYFEISPFYRLYFKSKNTNNSGFFVQPFLSLTSGEYDYYPYDYTYDSSNNSGAKDFFGLAGGAVIGRKWVNQKKYTFEIHTGVGRYFAFEKTNNAYREGTAYPRINFAIGKRF
ncbi:MAG: hypothetical protein VW976_02775 [Flavobacteriaceae bacterium]